MHKINKCVIFLTLSSVLFACDGMRGWTSEKPPVHLNWNMDTQEKGKPYRESNVFENGRIMQNPIEGTVARTRFGGTARDVNYLGLAYGMLTGKENGEYVNFPEGFEIDALTIARGRSQYEIYCAPCHSKAGDGNGPVARRLTVKPPNFADPAREIWKQRPGQIFETITYGKNAPNMPSYSGQIAVEDRWAIALYLQALVKAARPEVEIPDFGADSSGTKPDKSKSQGDR